MTTSILNARTDWPYPGIIVTTEIATTTWPDWEVLNISPGRTWMSSYRRMRWAKPLGLDVCPIYFSNLWILFLSSLISFNNWFFKWLAFILNFILIVLFILIKLNTVSRFFSRSKSSSNCNLHLHFIRFIIQIYLQNNLSAHRQKRMKRNINYNIWAKIHSVAIIYNQEFI